MMGISARLLLALLALALAGTLASCGAGVPGRGPATVATQLATSRSPLGPSGHEDEDGDHDFHRIAGEDWRATVVKDEQALAGLAAKVEFGLEAHEVLELDVDHDTDVFQGVLRYGRAATARDRRLVSAVIRRYLALASAVNGAAACDSLTVEARAAVVRFGESELKERQCASIATTVFGMAHAELERARRRLYLITVRTLDGKAIALLAFSQSSQGRQLTLLREGSAWKVAALVYGALPQDGEAH